MRDKSKIAAELQALASNKLYAEHLDKRVDADTVKHLNDRIKELEAKLEACTSAMQTFVDRVDRGEVRSKKTYAKFKEILND